MRMWVQSLASLSGLRILRWVSCGVVRRHSLDPVWFWLWLWLAAVALIRPLAWELPYAEGATLKSRERKKRKKEERVEATIYIHVKGKELAAHLHFKKRNVV